VGDLQDELNKMSKQGRWEAMGELITDDILEEFAVDGEPGSIPARSRHATATSSTVPRRLTRTFRRRTARRSSPS
jgi:hypothetical protein